ncbi:MAG: fibronectin type III-like domain-contianing protein, partial [Bacteroidales bacterium]|nr:fibronectin type III-like domain-contianing protein [Bacteroidales bacterium]
DEVISISIPVKNAGQRDGVELVQIYVRKIHDTDGPLKTLRGFQKVEVAAGKTARASIDLPPSTFEFYDWDQRKMAVVPGDYEVLYGNSSDGKDLKKVTLTIRRE